MHNIKFFLFIFFTGFLFGCKVSKGNLNKQSIVLNILDFGAVPDDYTDDSKAFHLIFERILRNPGNYTVTIPAGVFIIEKPIVAKNLTGKLYLKGSKGTIINITGSSFGDFSAKSFPISLVHDVSHDDSLLIINSLASKLIEANDLIHIKSNSNFESAWKYKENDIHRVKKVIKNEVYLKSKMLFNYSLSREKVDATIYKRYLIRFSDIEFRLDPLKESNPNPPRRTLASFWGIGLKGDRLKLVYNGSASYYHIGFSVLACEDVHFSNLSLEGFMYGVLLNFSRNIIGDNTVAENCRHAYTPSQACVNVSITNITGTSCHSVIDSHCSFNVHFKNVKDTSALEFPNCRALGTFIENAIFHVKKGTAQNVCYWSIQTLVPEYNFLYGKYDTKFKNVNWVTDMPTNLNGLTSYSCRNFLVEDCISHNIAFYGNENLLNKVHIKSSQIGMLHMDTQKLQVENSVFNGNLFKEAPYLIKLRGSGEAEFSVVDIINYNPSKTYLFGYFVNKPDNQGVHFNNVNIGKLKGWVDKFIYPGLAYNKLHISRSSIAPFEEEIPVEFKGNSKEIEKQIRN